jgi:glucokinase
VAAAVRGHGKGRGTIGVDLGGTKCFALALDVDGSVAASHRVPTPRGTEAIVESMVEVVESVRRQVGDGFDAVGVGLPGLVDNDGVLRFAPNLPGVVDVRLEAELAPRLPGARFRFENDATCAGWGERALGAARGADHALLVTLGTGIGGGIVTGGTLLRGANGFAGEIGHMVVDPHGPPCPCGKRGCWERYASGSGLGRLAREAAHAGRAGRMVELAGGDPENVRGEHVTEAAGEGDADASDVLAQFGWWLGLGLSNLANVFDPDRFVVGGGMVAAGELILAPARSAFADLVLGAGRRPPVPIVAAELGERAGAIGAAVLAREA